MRVELGIRDSAPIITESVTSPELGDQSLRILGVDPFAEPPFREYLTTINVEGENQDTFAALNNFIAQPDTLLMSTTLAQRFDIGVGDSITLEIGGASQTVQVVGLIQPDDNLSQQALDDLLLMDIATAQEVVGLPDRISRIDLILPDGYNIAQIRDILPAGVSLIAIVGEDSALSQMTAAFEINLQALSLLALVVGVFLIYNTVTFSVVQRRNIIGILRSLGTTRAQIFALIVGEALILGLVGTILGLGLGIIFGRFAVGLVSQTISDLYFTVNVQNVTLDAVVLLKGIAIGVGGKCGGGVNSLL